MQDNTFIHTANKIRIGLEIIFQLRCCRGKSMYIVKSRVQVYGISEAI
jgi:hypothetical protein